MTRLPRHRVSDISETGIRLRLFSPDNIRETPVNYVHQDDYYIFGFIAVRRKFFKTVVIN